MRNTVIKRDVPLTHPRLFDRLRDFRAEGDREREEWLRHCRNLAADAVPPSFDAWRAARLARGNREGQNHD